MKRRFFIFFLNITAFIIAGIILLLGGCTAPDHEGFAIYLTKGDIPPEKLSVLSHADIVAKPVIAMDDIVAYNAGTHEITLTASAFDRISSLEVPGQGKSFMVCVDKKLIYSGAFWTPVSSFSFDGVTIWKPLSSQDSRIIKLELGYPSPSFYAGEDPRSNAEVIKSLERAGKLSTVPSPTTLEKLPHSMKGHELYSWLEDGQWHFTLITGTNRTKTMEEIVSTTDNLSEDGWVSIHVVGADAIKTVLSRLPQGESIFWCDELHIGQTTGTNTDIQLPPEQITDAIKEHAERCGLDFAITVY